MTDFINSHEQIHQTPESPSLVNGGGLKILSLVVRGFKSHLWYFVKLGDMTM